MTHSYFNSAFTTVADALASGKCTLISNAMVYKVLVDSAHKRASGVLYIDRNTREQQELLSRVVILCAQAQESVRILFNSATREYANGLANSSGVLGHYLTAHVRSGGGSGEFPSMGTKPSLEGGRPHKPTGVYSRRTTSKICLLWMPPAFPRIPARTPRSRSWRSARAPAIT